MFIDEVKEIANKVAGPKEKVLSLAKEEITEMAKSGYKSKIFSPRDFATLARKALDWQEPTLLQYLDFVEFTLKSFRQEGFSVYVSEYEDKSGFFHVVKW
jgi:c-di-GMP-related signal transduction protein